MSDLTAYVNAALSILRMHIDICGYDVTFFQIFIFFAIAGSVLSFFYGVFK